MWVRASCVLEVLTAVRRDDDDTTAEKIDQTMDFLTGEEHGNDDDEKEEKEEKKGRGGERVTEPGQSGLPAIWGWEVRAVFHCRFKIFLTGRPNSDRVITSNAAEKVMEFFYDCRPGI